MRRRDLISGVLACAASSGRPAWAASHTQPLTLRQLVDGSEVVADVLVRRRESAWVEVFGGRRVVTFWQFGFVETIVGRAAGDAEVVTLGGAVGDAVQWVPHEARLSAGQRHLVFLRQGPFQRLWVTGMLQGAFELVPRDTSLYVSVSPAQDEFLESAGSAVARLAGIGLTAAKPAIQAARES